MGCWVRAALATVVMLWVQGADAQVFAPGLYFVRPALDRPGGTIELFEGTMPVAVSFTGGGFDVTREFIVTTNNNDTLILYRADGTTSRVRVQGLYGMGRPSLSPDGKRVAVQATETAVVPGTPPQFFTIYVVDLATGAFTRLAPPNPNPMTGNELPEWFPTGDRIAHQGIEDNCMIIRVYDVASQRALVTIRRDGTSGCYQPQRGIEDGTRFHTAVSADSARLLIVGQMQIYDARTGAKQADLHRQVMDGLARAGYQPDAQFRGQGGGGTFPLDGTFSPDGRSIVFDGAVQKDGTYGVLLARINTDGTGFTILRAPIEVNPMFSNNHNYSQLRPTWK